MDILEKLLALVGVKPIGLVVAKTQAEHNSPPGKLPPIAQPFSTLPIPAPPPAVVAVAPLAAVADTFEHATGVINPHIHSQSADNPEGLDFVRDPDTDVIRPVVRTPNLPVFTDIGAVASLPNTTDATQAVDTAILKDVPLAGVFFESFGGITTHENAAGLSPQQIAYIRGTGQQYSQATGTAQNANSAQIAVAQRAVIDRMDAVENKDGSKQVPQADAGGNPTGSYVRVGGTFGRASREDIDSYIEP